VNYDLKCQAWQPLSRELKRGGGCSSVAASGLAGGLAGGGGRELNRSRYLGGPAPIFGTIATRRANNRRVASFLS
jgi:hypothetical protein